MSCFFKKLAEEHVPKKRLSVNVSHAVFCLFDLLTFEDGTDRLSWRVGKELPLYAA